MHTIYLSLIRAGFKDEMALTPQGGVTIRYNTEALPFGPPSAPKDQIYAHMAIDHDGKVTDIWISIKDGTPYQYAANS